MGLLESRFYGHLGRQVAQKSGWKEKESKVDS